MLHDFHQHVQEPTRDIGTLLDHLYSRGQAHIQTKVYDCYYSDHDIICADISLP